MLHQTPSKLTKGALTGRLKVGCLLTRMEIPFDSTPDIVYNKSRLAKTFPQRNLKFIPRQKNGPFAFNLGLMFLPKEINPILKEQGCKRYALMIFDFNNLEIVFILLRKVLSFYIPIPMI